MMCKVKQNLLSSETRKQFLENIKIYVKGTEVNDIVVIYLITMSSDSQLTNITKNRSCYTHKSTG